MRDVPGWHEYYMTMAKTVASRSKDPRTQVGSVITARDHSPISMGYNGFPRDLIESEYRWGPVEKYKFVVHAEVNAILNAAKAGIPTKDSVMYVTLFPCSQCALQLITAGVKVVFYDHAAQEARIKEKPEFAEGFEFSKQLLDEANVGYFGI